LFNRIAPLNGRRPTPASTTERRKVFGKNLVNLKGARLDTSALALMLVHHFAKTTNVASTIHAIRASLPSIDIDRIGDQ
jgi:hypothetical protein